MATTYCTRTDVEAIISTAGLLACIDDNENGQEDGSEGTYITKAIERAAVNINLKVGRQYKLSDVTANAWLKWANAVIALSYLSKRRNNPLPESLGQDVKETEDLLNEIGWGRASLPEQVPSFDHSAAVSNFRVEMGHSTNPVRVNVNESTGNAPVDGITRNTTSTISVY